MERDGVDGRTFRCPCCWEDDLTLKEGVLCGGAGQHFTCNVCLERHTRAVSETLLGLRGGINCPVNNCDFNFTNQVLAKVCSAEVFDAYEAAKNRQVEARIQAELEAGFQERLEAERNHQHELSPEEQILRGARKHIQEEILTLKCPRCKRAFVDFDACCALTCRDAQGNGCGAAFCAFCLTLCGHDAHRHVANCDLNINPNKSVFGSFELFQTAQRTRQGATARAYLLSLSDIQRTLVSQGCEGELRDLGLGREFVPADIKVAAEEEAGNIKGEAEVEAGRIKTAARAEMAAMKAAAMAEADTIKAAAAENMKALDAKEKVERQRTAEMERTLLKRNADKAAEQQRKAIAEEAERSKARADAEAARIKAAAEAEGRRKAEEMREAQKKASADAAFSFARAKALAEEEANSRHAGAAFDLAVARAKDEETARRREGESAAEWHMRLVMVSSYVLAVIVLTLACLGLSSSWSKTDTAVSSLFAYYFNIVGYESQYPNSAGDGTDSSLSSYADCTQSFCPTCASASATISGSILFVLVSAALYLGAGMVLALRPEPETTPVRSSADMSNVPSDEYNNTATAFRICGCIILIAIFALLCLAIDYSHACHNAIVSALASCTLFSKCATIVRGGGFLACVWCLVIVVLYMFSLVAVALYKNGTIHCNGQRSRSPCNTNESLATSAGDDGTAYKSLV